MCLIVVTLLATSALAQTEEQQQCIQLCTKAVEAAAQPSENVECGPDCQAAKSVVSVLQEGDVSKCSTLPQQYVEGCKDKLAFENAADTNSFGDCQYAANIAECEQKLLMLSRARGVAVDCDSITSAQAQSACKSISSAQGQTTQRSFAGAISKPSDPVLLGILLAIVVVLIVVTIRFNSQRKSLEVTVKNLEAKLAQYGQKKQ